MKAVHQGGLELLQHPASQELLHSKIPARLAYIATDGTPRGDPHLVSLEWTGLHHGDPAQGAQAEGAQEKSAGLAYHRRQYFSS
jgi:hypothetical protein